MPTLIVPINRAFPTITWVFGKANGPNDLSDWDPVVEPEECDVVLEVHVAKVGRDRPDHEPRLRLGRCHVAPIVLAERHFDHEPHETVKQTMLVRHTTAPVSGPQPKSIDNPTD